MDTNKMHTTSECLFNKSVKGAQCTVTFHVDDLLITCIDMFVIDGLEIMLKAIFSPITINKGNKHSYLAMNVEVGDDGIHVDMIAYIHKVLEGKNVKKK